MKLKGRRALVTGASSGIGRAIALRFAEEGADVAITGRRAARLAETATRARTHGGTVVEILAEHTQAADNTRAVAQAVAGLGGLDILVNAAGVIGNDSIAPAKPDEWRRILDNNLEAVYDLTHRATPHIVAGVRGSIVNLSSVAGLRPYANLLGYCVSKAAINTLTQCLALELAPRGVRVNAVAPGYTLSDGLKAKIAKGERNPEAIQATTALRRFVEPRDVAEAALFLCSDRAGAITGVTLPVDAGWLVQAPYAQYLQGNPIRQTSAN